MEPTIDPTLPSSVHRAWVTHLRSVRRHAPQPSSLWETYSLSNDHSNTTIICHFHILNHSEGSTPSTHDYRFANMITDSACTDRTSTLKWAGGRAMDWYARMRGQKGKKCGWSIETGTLICGRWDAYSIGAWMVYIGRLDSIHPNPDHIISNPGRDACPGVEQFVLKCVRHWTVKPNEMNWANRINHGAPLRQSSHISHYNYSVSLPTDHRS